MPPNKFKGSFTNRNSRITKPPFDSRLDTFVTQDLRVSFNYTADRTQGFCSYYRRIFSQASQKKSKNFIKTPAK